MLQIEVSANPLTSDVNEYQKGLPKEQAAFFARTRENIQAVRHELDCAHHSPAHHYSRATYNLGCRGIMCKLVAAHESRYKRFNAGLPITPRDYEHNLEDRLEKHLTRWIIAMFKTLNRPFSPSLKWVAAEMGIRLPVQQLLVTSEEIFLTVAAEYEISLGDSLGDGSSREDWDLNFDGNTLSVG